MYAHTYVSMYVQCVHTWHSLQHSTTQHNTCAWYKNSSVAMVTVSHTHVADTSTHTACLCWAECRSTPHPTPPPYITHTPPITSHPTPPCHPPHTSSGSDAYRNQGGRGGGGNQQWFYALVTRKADTDVSAATCCYVAGCLVYPKGPHKLKMNLSSIASMWNMYIRYSIHSIH